MALPNDWHHRLHPRIHSRVSIVTSRFQERL